MPIRRAVVRFPSVTGLPEDEITNTWHFQDSGTFPTSTVTADIASALSTFYGAIDEYIPAFPFGSATPTIVCDHYEVPPGGVVGEPVAQSNLLGITFPTTFAGLPLEVSLCLSFHADLTGLAESMPGGEPGPAGDQKPRARRRGRVYIGPLHQGDIISADGSYRPDTGFRAALAAAGGALMTSATLDSSDCAWSVYSRKADEAYSVAGGWVDDEFDTQRRRGRTATTRSIF